MPVSNVKYPLLGTIAGAKGCGHPKALGAPGPPSQESPEDQQALKTHRPLVPEDAGSSLPFPMWSSLMVRGIAATQECSSCAHTKAMATAAKIHSRQPGGNGVRVGTRVAPDPGVSWRWSPGWGKALAITFVLWPLCSCNRTKTLLSSNIILKIQTDRD